MVNSFYSKWNLCFEITFQWTKMVFKKYFYWLKIQKNKLLIFVKLCYILTFAKGVLYYFHTIVPPVKNVGSFQNKYISGKT